MNKILILFGHSRTDSFCGKITEQYMRGAVQTGYDVDMINLNSLNLERYLKYEHLSLPAPDEEIIEIQQAIAAAGHLVIAYPTWWASPPALVKLFFEMIFEPGFAFKYLETDGPIPKWEKLLKGKSARIISTMDSPPWYYKWITGDPGYKAVAKGVLGFCGVNPVYTSYFGSVKTSSGSKRKQWLEQAYRTGLNE